MYFYLIARRSSQERTHRSLGGDACKSIFYERVEGFHPVRSIVDSSVEPWHIAGIVALIHFLTGGHCQHVLFYYVHKYQPSLSLKRINSCEYLNQTGAGVNGPTDSSEGYVYLYLV